MNRNLDGCYFRVQRNGKQEREEILQDRNAEWLKSLCGHLADRLMLIGEQFNIVGE